MTHYSWSKPLAVQQVGIHPTHLDSASDLETSCFLISEVHSQKYILGYFQPTYLIQIQTVR